MEIPNERYCSVVFLQRPSGPIEDFFTRSKRSSERMTMQVLRKVSILGVGVVSLGAMLLAQKNSVQPQPQPDKLAKVAVPTRGMSNPIPKPDGVMPTVPQGFTVSVYAEMPSPRMMVYAPNGDLFVSSPATNTITVLRDGNNDGVFEERGVYAQGAAAGGGRGGGGAAGAGAGARGPGAGGGGRGPGGAPGGPGGPGRGAGGPGGAPGGPPAAAPAAAAPAEPNPTINGPLLGANAPACTPPPEGFATKGPGTLAAPFGLAFNNGYLYVGNTGSIVRYKYTDGDLKAQGEPEKLMDLPTGGHSTRNIVFNRAGTKMYVAVGSSSNNNAGEDCRRAAVLEFNPDGTGYRVFASGIRNPVGLTLQPGSDIPWVAINERDNLGDDLVPDYATSVKDGGFYGWPYSYIGKNPDPRYVGAFPELVNRAIVPDVLIPAHSAALGMAFYTANQFPQKYRGGGFVALHGSWNRRIAAGYKVAFFPMVNGKPGPLEDFMTGLLANDGSEGPIQPWARPVGVTVARDGSLLISDDAQGGGRIWKVSAAPAGGARRGN
jgi:glucose/arabinose dehydrogenase